MRVFAVVQIVMGMLKLWMGYKLPKRRAWHLASGAVIILLGIGMYLTGSR